MSSELSVGQLRETRRSVERWSSLEDGAADVVVSAPASLHPFSQDALEVIGTILLNLHLVNAFSILHFEMC